MRQKKTKRKNRTPFQIAITLMCSTRCDNCNQHLDVIDWGHIDTNITVSDIKYSGDCLHKHGIVAGRRLRVTGGEPTLHPRFVDIIKAIQLYWRQDRKIRVYTHKMWKWPDSWCEVVESPLVPDKPKRPFRISPADLGIEIEGLGEGPCHVQVGCGGGFTHFGFAPCPWGGTVGGLLGMDVFSTKPVLKTTPDLCKHCICALPTKKQRCDIQQQVMDGKIPNPTKTFREGIDRWHDSPFSPMTLEERLIKEKQ